MGMYGLVIYGLYEYDMWIYKHKPPFHGIRLYLWDDDGFYHDIDDGFFMDCG